MASVKPVDFAPPPQPDVIVTNPKLFTRPGTRYTVAGRPYSVFGRRVGPLTRLRRFLAPLLDSKSWKALMAASLFFALFGGSLWQLFDIPDDPGNAVLDALMSSITVLFALEIILNCLVDYREYPWSFFCLTDVLGTVSMIFEISFILGPAGKIQNGATNAKTVLMRTARAAKVGARVGRLSKLVKCLSVAYKGSSLQAETTTAEAKVLSQRLMLALSTKVSLLTILLVLVVPLFDIGQYPEEDLSMREWTDRLEEEYRRSVDAVVFGERPGSNESLSFRRTVDKMVLFYEDINYGLFRLEGFPEQVTVNNLTVTIPGCLVLEGLRSPVRKQNIFRQEVSACALSRPQCNSAAALFDFKAPKQLEAATDIAMIVFVVLVMAVVSFNLSQTLDAMVVRPLERMLGMMKTMAASLLRQFGIDDEQNEEEDRELVDETQLIESIFRKLARLASLATQSGMATDEELREMDDEGKGVLMDIMNMKHSTVGGVRERQPSVTSSVHSASSAETPDGATSGLTAVAQHLPVAKQVIDSWELDVLELDHDGLKAIVFHVIFDSNVSGRSWTRVDTFHRFHSHVRAGYNDLPYHCYAHACDVLHTVYRILTVTASDRWLNSIDRYALLVAALCHDVGHQGKTNPFLVETKHELALRYNDKSPLENMHCARLFEICSMEGNNVFERADYDAQKQARRVCIAAILHTDNANHFEMVKDISKVYELLSEVCEAQAAHHGELLPGYQDQVLQKNTMLWLELFLHFADVSNPLKPWKICKVWAWRVLDEFFMQGDEEKRLGLPVGMLNDRDKINRPGSQHGFINFLVAPLVTTSVKLFPPLHPLSTQMAKNMESWRDLWVEDAKPSVEDIAKRDADVQKIRSAAADLAAR